MLIRVKLFGELRQVAEKNWMTIEVSAESSITELLIELDRKLGTKLCKKIIEGNQVRPEIAILVNGRSITHLQGLKTILKDHDLISLLPVVGGGQVIRLEN